MKSKTIRAAMRKITPRANHKKVDDEKGNISARFIVKDLQKTLAFWDHMVSKRLLYKNNWMLLNVIKGLWFWGPEFLPNAMRTV